MTIQHHVDCFKKQMSKLVDFSDGKALMADNGDWLLGFELYSSFFGRWACISTVNRMLDLRNAYKQRMERGLSFFELNYMIMQSYDFFWS